MKIMKKEVKREKNKKVIFFYSTKTYHVSQNYKSVIVIVLNVKSFYSERNYSVVSKLKEKLKNMANF